TGTVTDSTTGDPIAGAGVLVEGGAVPRQTTTDENGVYTINLSAGDYDVTVSAYGYETATQSVTVLAGETTTLDFALEPLPRTVVSGTVTDGSGHGWPLYARIDIGGFPGGPVFTNPVTGRYSIELIQSTDYTFTVNAILNGYSPETRDVTVPPDDATQDFALEADPTCTAPGYDFGVDGLYESFDSGSLPDGWEVVDNLDNGQVWVFDDPAGRGNLTGGEGPFAIVDSDFHGSEGIQDTELVTSSVDLSGNDDPRIIFNHDLNAFQNEIFDVDLSTDGGATWTNVWQQTGQDGSGDLRGPRVEEIPIPDAAGESDVKARFHYYDATFEWWWEVDNVLVGQPACVVVEGGLLVGNVTDALTGAPLDGATVTSDDNAEDTATTVPTPDDPNLADGFYMLFSSLTGPHRFTATKALYGPLTRRATIVADGVVRRNFALGSGHLVVDPTSIEESVDLGESVDVTLTITNDGTADATFELGERGGGFEIAGLGAGATPVRVPAQVTPGWSGTFDRSSATPSTPAAAPSEPPWTDIADFPSDIMDNAADTLDGLVYSVGGFDGGANINGLYIYDPATDSWSQGASMATIREKPGAAFIDGLLYVTGGWGESGEPTPSLEIYDPSSDTWTAGADAPAGRAAPGIAVLDGQLYEIGGCENGPCSTDPSVFRYDPASDSWETLGDYPEDVGWESCGTADDVIYCAGGVGDNGEQSTAYAYDPGSDSWTGVASLPITLWGSAHVAANGQLLISGGVTGGGITNEGFAYDPASDAWTSLPASNNLVYRSAGACGFYKIGGSIGGFTPNPASEVLPGFDQCGAPSDVPWLSLDPVTGTVPAGESVDVIVTLDASVVEVDQPGTYTASITVKEDTPHAVEPVPVTMEVIPPPTWGKLEGTVSGLGRCDAEGGPLAGATVEVDGVSKDFALETDA
ncbi:MAG: carboxypeptidase regulatory-like domain-containing protein, partial [Acidimicrobiales bacterium]